ncbi:hypothetical protein [Nonomuraea jabiensis]|uniref:hypothetical protein n=1 Tax=Nonomuraea jabiensis TaxID=882448 RepID=UPI003D71B319
MTADVTPEEIQDLFRNLQKEERAKVCHRLGMRVTSRMGLSMARQVLNAARRMGLNNDTGALMALTTPVMTSVYASLLNPEGQPTESAGQDEWSVAQRRLALWAWMSASALGARMLVAQAHDDWWLPAGVLYEQGQAMLKAARNVIEATPDFVTATAFAPAAPPTPALEEAEDESSPRETGASELKDKVEETLADARSAVLRIGAALELGRAAHPDDLAVIRSFGDAMDEAIAWLAAQEMTAAEAAASSVMECLGAADLAKTDAVWRKQLSTVTRFAGPAEVQGVLSRLHEVAKQLESTEVWDADQRETARGLLALGELVDLAAAPGGCAEADPVTLADCQTRVSSLPPDLAMLTIFAVAGKLHITPVVPVEGLIGESREQDANLEIPDVSTEDVKIPDEDPGSGTSDVEEDIAVQDGRGELNEKHAVGEVSPTGAEIAKLIGQGRFGMAHAVAQADGWPEGRLWALRVAALGRQVRPEKGPSTARLLNELNREELRPEPFTLLLAVPALLRTALVTGDHVVGALLTEASGRVEPHLGQVMTEVGEQVLRGTLLEAPLVGMLADVGQLEHRITRAAAMARELLTSSRKLRFQRASAIAKQWLRRDDLLGSFLTVVVDDARDHTERVAEAAHRLAEPDEAEKEIDKTDSRYLKNHSGKPVEGPSRQDLRALIGECVDVASEWLHAVAALERHTSSGKRWATEGIANLRSLIGKQRAGVLAGLAQQKASADALVSAAAAAADTEMSEIFALLDGHVSLAPGEEPADLGLTVELLKVPGAEVDTRSLLVKIPDTTTSDVLIEAAALDWTEAVARHTAAENFPIARGIIDLTREGRIARVGGDIGPLVQGGVEEKVADAEAKTRSELSAKHRTLLTDVQRARARNELSDEQENDLVDALRLFTPEQRMDLFRVRKALDEISATLAQHRAEAARRLRDRLERLSARLEVAEADLARINRLIESGELAAADEHIYLLEIGETVPVQTGQEDLKRFFPTVPEVMSDGITTELLETVREGGCYSGAPTLDFSALSPDVRSSAAEALELWVKLAKSRPEERANLSHRDLLQVTKLIGIEAQKVDRRDDIRRDRARRFVDLIGVSITGKAVVPAFGSKLGIRDPRGGRLRVLLVWDRPSADLLMDWVDHDPSGDSILVAYFGTMPPPVRRRLAVRAIDTAAPVVVIDDALLAYVAANGPGRLETTMAVALPFSSVNPYIRSKRMLVAPEMFYGRDRECRSILDPDGTQVIFGGRGLGKSALLRESKDRFEREPERVAVHVELTLTADGGGLGAGAVWDRLSQTLKTAGVIRPPASKKQHRDPWKEVHDGILDWLRRDSRRKLLILLDECDEFFESDSSNVAKFRETKRLKELVLESGGRAKVVFAGLHSVQRFAKLTSNGPFSHIGKAMVVGPLRPKHAFDLITRPLGALGFSFEASELVHRILNHCTYQPYLLQMFGSRLIEAMNERRTKDLSGPPYSITEEDVEAVESDTELRHDIIGAFRDTLILDPRYNVIANVLAHYAYENELDARMSDTQLAEECQVWWPEGFAKLDAEAFRSYLSELVGLGVLRPNTDGVGWRLRSPNALSMIGTSEEVESELVRAKTESVPPEVIARQTRRTLIDGTRWPITISQVNDLLGDHTNQVRLVLGSAATGIENVTPTMIEVVREHGERFQYVVAGGRRDFTEALTNGTPGRRRLILSDLAANGTKPEGCWESLCSAIHLSPVTSGVTRSVVLVADTTTLPFWARVFDEDSPEVGVVRLRRYDRRGLEVWALEVGKFGAEDKRDRLLRVTSGWPYLVERVLSISATTGSEDEALHRVANDLAAPHGQAELIDLVGLSADDAIAGSFAAIREWMDPNGMSHADLVTAAKLAGADAPVGIVGSLLALEIFDLDANGRYHLDPLVKRAWPD